VTPLALAPPSWWRAERLREEFPSGAGLVQPPDSLRAPPTHDQLNVQEVNVVFDLLGRGIFHDEAAAAATADVAQIVVTDQTVAVEFLDAAAREVEVPTVRASLRVGHSSFLSFDF